MADVGRPARSAKAGGPLHDPFAADTIAAIASASGRAAVTVVRMSGPEAAAILLEIAPELGSMLPRAREQRLLRILDPSSGELLDRSLVCYFPGPNSYTGQDVVEITTHGGLLTPSLVLHALLSAGARGAAPGEFTRRALFNGKIDLTQAEATLDLIEASSPALHRAAVHQLDRGLATRIEGLRVRLLGVEAMIAYGIDFPDEDEPPVPPTRILSLAEELVKDLRALLRTAPEGEMLREGALVVFAGLPNVGKSSLFNALLGRERSIVTDLPGTTRDAVEAHVVLGGFPFRLVDTAGLRHSEDRVESIGIEVAQRYLSAADILVFCVPAADEVNEKEMRLLADRQGRPALLVRTKSELAGHGEPGQQGVRVSAITGDGLDVLRSALVEAAFGGIGAGGADEVILTTRRQSAAIESAVAGLERFQLELRAGTYPELAATYLRDAVRAMEAVIGVVSEDDILDVLFGQFCVGK